MCASYIRPVVSFSHSKTNQKSTKILFCLQFFHWRMLIPIRVSMNFYHFELACLFVCRLAKHRVRSYRRPFVLIAALTNFFFDNSLDRRMTTQCTTTDQRHHVKNLNSHSITSKLAQSVCQNGVIFVPDITSDAIGLWKKKLQGACRTLRQCFPPIFGGGRRCWETEPSKGLSFSLLLRTGLSVFHGFASKRYCHCCCCCDVSSRAGALRASAVWAFRQVGPTKANQAAFYFFGWKVFLPSQPLHTFFGFPCTFILITVKATATEVRAKAELCPSWYLAAPLTEPRRDRYSTSTSPVGSTQFLTEQFCPDVRLSLDCELEREIRRAFKAFSEAGKKE